MHVTRVLVVSFLAAFVMGFGYGRVAGVPWTPTDEYAAGTVVPASTVPTTVPPTAAPTTSTSEAPTTTTTEPATTTTTEPPLPPGGRRPTPDKPLRVVMAGDSVMAGLWPPVKAALEAGGSAEVRFVLTPSILRDPSIRFTWEQQLEDFNPDVIVMFVGTWESRQVETHSGQKLSLGEPGWRESYEREVLDPWIQFISAKGARVIWIGSPVVAGAEANAVFGALNQVFAGLPERFPQVTYLDAGPALQGPSPGFHDIIPGDGGRPVRTRQLDGLHLCPDGAALVAKPLLTQLLADWEVPVAYGWQALPWRDDARVYPAASCPAPV